MSDWWLIEHSLSLVLELLVRDPTEISESRGRWAGDKIWTTSLPMIGPPLRVSILCHIVMKYPQHAAPEM